MFETLARAVRGRGWMFAAAGLVLAAVGVGYALFGDLNVSDIIGHYGEISERVIARPAAAFVVATALYTLLVVLLLPGVPLMAIPLGLILGWGMAILVTLSATALGVSVLYGLTAWVLPDRFGDRKSGVLSRLAKGLRDDGVGYMLFLRLMPPVPFTLLNLALPALRVPYVQFLGTALIGMFPRLAAYCFAGEGLRGVIDDRLRACAVQVPPCTPDFSLSDFVTTEIVIATGLLAVVSLAPIGIKRFYRRENTPG